MRLFLPALFFFCTLAAYAQNFLSWKYNDRYFSANIGTGSASYFGELNAKKSINNNFSMASIGLEARLLSKIAARFEVGYISLNGSDANAPNDSFERQRNLSFESRNFQIRLDGIYYLKPYKGDFYKRWAVDPYVLSGVGYLQYNPAARLGDERFLLREARTEEVDYKKWAFTLPLGAGLKFRVNEFLNVNFEVIYHFTFTDYIDDVSTTYGESFDSFTAEFLSDRKDEIGVINAEFYDQIEPGATRGDSSKNDSFLTIGIKAEFFVPPNLFKNK